MSLRPALVRGLAGVCLASLPALAPANRLQSAVHPQGAAASDIAFIWWLMLVGAVVIFAGVLSLLLYGLLARQPRREVSPKVFIVGGGLVFPGVVLTALLVYTVIVGARLTADPTRDALTIEVTGHMWWWEVNYPGAGGVPALVTANELRIPVGRPVALRVRSADVIHSFWVPNLAGKIDMIPGRVNQLTLQADTPGIFRGQCAEFCGLQHTQMALHVVVQSQEEWDAWFASRRAAPAVPVTEVALHGRRLFAEAGCVACHAVRGLSDPPAGLGPDLTHMGSRPTIAAGLLPNNRGNLVAWIASAQTLKPGSKMPSFHNLDGESLTALATYLSGLE